MTTSRSFVKHFILLFSLHHVLFSILWLEILSILWNQVSFQRGIKAPSYLPLSQQYPVILLWYEILFTYATLLAVFPSPFRTAFLLFRWAGNFENSCVTRLELWLHVFHDVVQLGKKWEFSIGILVYGG